MAKQKPIAFSKPAAPAPVKAQEGAKSESFRVFYSRPPLFLVVSATSPEQLAQKVSDLSAKLDQQDTSGASA